MFRRDFLTTLGAAAAASAAMPGPIPLGINTYCLRSLRWTDAQLLDYCAAQRLDSWHAFLDGMAELDSGLDVPAPVSGVEGFELRVGERSARVVFDGGDGRLSPQFVTDALQAVRRQRDRFPVQREDGVIGAAYYNDRYPGAWKYTHPDHLAVHRALFDTDQGLPGLT